MLDKNGKEMVTGCVVEIKNAYFKTDNGLYFVEKSPEELGWLGSDYCLLKLKRNGQLSTAKKNICFWPIMSFVSDRMKSIEASAWNKEHATIEIRTDIDRHVSVIDTWYVRKCRNTVAGSDASRAHG